MSKITNFAKNLLLSADEKLLREMGLKTECGTYTSEAIEVLLQKLCRENESYLLEIANGLKAEK